MTKKHARLASAVADAMLAQGFTQKHVATAAGITQSALCQAISGKYDIKEERWRMICENLGLCYEDVIADPEPEAAPPAPEEIGGGDTRSRYSKGGRKGGNARFQPGREKVA